MSSDPQDRPKLDLPLAPPPQPLDLPAADASTPTSGHSSTTDDAMESDPTPAINPEVAAMQQAIAALTADKELLAKEILDLQQKKQALVDEQTQALQAKKDTLIAEIEAIKSQKQSLFDEQTGDLQSQVQQFMTQSLQTLEQKQTSLQKSVDSLERRREKIREEMRTTFAGTSQEIAVRVQGFRDYLMGSLQDLVMAAEQLDFPSYEENWSQAAPVKTEPEPPKQKLEVPQFSKQGFATRIKRIESTLDQYRMAPDYYGPPWQLRRTFEPIHSERVKKWFFTQGGRGTVRSMGSRLQNILVASASVSVLSGLYGDRLKTLILANTPERLGEWRRGLQDCLGISRSDFGPNSGVILFENSDALVQKADRLTEDDRLPLIIIDEAEDNINLSLLQYPLWLAFAPEPQSDSSYFF
jgi:hypothetical protein